MYLLGYSDFCRCCDYSNLFLSLTFFLNCSHFAFGYELIVCPEAAGFVKVIGDFLPLIQRDKSLVLYLGEVHCFQRVQQFLTGVFRIQFFLKVSVDG